MIDLPQVDETRCTGCGDCVIVCPTDCLGMHFALPRLVKPGSCISCALCVAICPDEALRMGEQVG